MEEQLPESILAEILAAVARETGRDFGGYKRSTLSRRIRRRMEVHLLDAPEQYLRHLRAHPAEADRLRREFFIGVTSFFRDPDAFEALQTKALPQAVAAARPRGELRAWVAGCATGEEAYSIAMLLQEQAAADGGGLAVRIFATDLDEAALATARRGRYPAAIAETVPAERLRRHFVTEADGYRVQAGLRKTVLFAPQSLTADPPFRRLDLISCRNLLIYLEREQQAAVLKTFAASLRPGGVLFLGRSENVPSANPDFEMLDGPAKILRRRPRARAGAEGRRGGARAGA